MPNFSLRSLMAAARSAAARCYAVILSGTGFLALEILRRGTLAFGVMAVIDTSLNATDGEA